MNELFSYWGPILAVTAAIVVILKLITSRRGMAKASRYRNRANGYEEDVGLAWLWCLLFGPFYFAVKGVWSHAVVSFFLAIFTFGLCWLLYPLFAGRLVAKHYLRRGWTPVGLPSTPSALTNSGNPNEPQQFY